MNFNNLKNSGHTQSQGVGESFNENENKVNRKEEVQMNFKNFLKDDSHKQLQIQQQTGFNVKQIQKYGRDEKTALISTNKRVQ